MSESHYVETVYGVNDAEYFNFEGKEYLVAGLDDGTI